MTRRLMGLAVVLLVAGPAPAADNPMKAPLLTLGGHMNEVYTIAFAPDGKRLAAACNSQVKVWDLASGKEVFTYTVKGTNVYGVACSPDGKLIAVGVSKQIKLLDAANGAEKSTLTCGPNWLF